jgi:hypothetical protein
MTKPRLLQIQTLEPSRRHTFQVTIRWTHHKWGPQCTRMKQHASSIRRAMNQAVQAFFTEQQQTARTTKKRTYLDAHKHIVVEAWRLS